MAAFKDLTKEGPFGWIEPIRPIRQPRKKRGVGEPRPKTEGTLWECLCKGCGNICYIYGNRLSTGNTRSCGCMHYEHMKGNKLREKHGGWGTKEWNSWSAMVRRCTDKTIPQWGDYGGRGIFVCQRWLDNFANFREDMGLMPTDSPGRYSIDRINNEGNYTCGHCDDCNNRQQPANCRWATCTEQSQNTRTNREITFNGETLCLSEWARRIGINPNTLAERLDVGWLIEDALTTGPISGRRHSSKWSSTSYKELRAQRKENT